MAILSRGRSGGTATRAEERSPKRTAARQGAGAPRLGVCTRISSLDAVPFPELRSGYKHLIRGLCCRPRLARATLGHTRKDAAVMPPPERLPKSFPTPPPSASTSSSGSPLPSGCSQSSATTKVSPVTYRARPRAPRHLLGQSLHQGLQSDHRLQPGAHRPPGHGGRGRLAGQSGRVRHPLAPARGPSRRDRSRPLALPARQGVLDAGQAARPDHAGLLRVLRGPRHNERLHRCERDTRRATGSGEALGGHKAVIPVTTVC